MGYFTTLYLIEGKRKSDSLVEVSTSVMCGETGDVPYFSWISGRREGALVSYCGETIFSNTELKALQGYPVREEHAMAHGSGDILLVRARFTPDRPDGSTVCHVVLPKMFVPRRDIKPMVQPEPPYVKTVDNGFVLTWAVQGSFDIQFCATELRADEKLTDFDANRLMVKEGESPAKIGVELNLGVIKFKFGTGSA